MAEAGHRLVTRSLDAVAVAVSNEPVSLDESIELGPQSVVRGFHVPTVRHQLDPIVVAGELGAFQHFGAGHVPRPKLPFKVAVQLVQPVERGGMLLVDMRGVAHGRLGTAHGAHVDVVDGHVAQVFGERLSLRVAAFGQCVVGVVGVAVTDE